MNISKIKLIVSEVDGVITENLTGMGELNVPMFKQFYMKDFEAINELKKHWTFVFLSKDPTISMSLCRKRNIPFYHAERSKIGVFNKILLKYSLTADQVLYIGDTYSDVECMKSAGLSFCPEDSPAAVRNVADLVLPNMGGTGVLCATHDILYDTLLKDQRRN